MNSYPSQFQIQKYISKRNLIIAASALVSAYGIWKLYQHKKGSYKKALHKVTIDSPSMPKCLSAITQEESTKWLACLSNVRYDISLSLFHKPTFQGKCTVTFDLSHIPDDLFLLFQGKEILSFRVNDKDLIPDHETLIQGQRFYIPSEYLKFTTNAVHIDYVANYHNDGSGLLLQVDYDGQPYVYSNCEPFSSQAIFPCFNTMGLRSTFILQVTCPQDWIAVSNESVKYTSKADSESTFGFFETQPIMCYIFLIACGPFCKIDAPKIYRGIQSSFYCKQSLSKHLEEQKEEIANLVCHGLDFFESFFGVPYPFSKHDMIFCPEFLTIAMECPGAITFCDEEFLFRDKPSYSQRVRRAYITLHEMAHMWFGNIVNIVWYDEIWLKESFASFFGYFALTHPKLQSLFPGAWDYIELYKEHGLIWDNFKTLRHPLARGPLTNSHGAEFNYDDINYCKGSGIWKVLWAQLGQETFKQVIQDYINTNAWNAVTRTNFYTSLRKATHVSNFKAEEFIKNWLETEGTDSVQAHLEEVNGKIEEAKITICRDPPNSERIHLLKFALIYSGQSIEVQTITLNGDTNDLKININKDKDLKGVICNYDGLDLIKARLDRRTIDYFLSNLAEIRQTDPNLETYFWRQLTLMVHNHDFPGEEFLDIVKTQFDNDLSGIMQIHSELLSRSEEFLDSSQAQKLKTYIADKALEMLRASNCDDDEQKYLEHLMENAQSVKHFEKALPIINENLGTKGTEISTWINLGTGLIKNLLKTEFFERLASLIEQFFLASKGHCYEETYRLAAVYRLLKPYIENEVMDPAHFLESLITEEFISLKPREKRLFWTIVRHKYSKIFASQEYKAVYFEKLPSLYQKFYRLDAYAIIDNLFPEFDGDLQESINYLQGCADKVKDQEIVLFFIHENLDKLKHKCCHKPL